MLLKNEFDLLRNEEKRHELMAQYNIDAVPLKHPKLPFWRDDYKTYTGATTIHQPTNLEVTGIVDDIWIDKEREYLIVDYKATATSQEISLEDKWKQGYKRQIEIYQWIFRQNGFKVSDTGYFVFANSGKNREKFDGHLEFELSIIPYIGNTDWIETTLKDIKTTLNSETIPDSGPECEYCAFQKGVEKMLNRNPKLL